MYLNYEGCHRVIPATHRPISAWGYFGYRLLYSIPVIGWIFLIVHAIAANNVNVRHHARSFFCTYLLVLLVAAGLLVIGLCTGMMEETFVQIEEIMKAVM